MTEKERLEGELKRCRELLGIYQSIPTGGFGAMMIQWKIEQGEKALASGAEPWMKNAADELADCTG